MTFPDFLSASYALLAEEHQRINPLKDLLSVAHDVVPSQAPVRPSGSTVKTSVAQQNAQSMAILTGGLMGNVKNNPLKKVKQ